MINESSDKTPPVLSNVKLTYDQKTSRIQFSGDIQDDRSGFETLWIRLESDSTDEDLWLSVGEWNINWAKGDNGKQRSGSFKVTEKKLNLGSGAYTITDAEISDRAGNKLNLWRWDNKTEQKNATEELKNAGLDIENLKLSVSNPNADLTLPKFSEFQLDKKGTINADTDSTLKISGTVSDGSGSGFSSLQFILADKNGTEKNISLSSDSTQIDKDGKFSLTTDFKYSAPGSWSLKEAFLVDEAGNQASFYDGDWDSNKEKEKFLSSGINLDLFQFELQ